MTDTNLPPALGSKDTCQTCEKPIIFNKSPYNKRKPPRWRHLQVEYHEPLPSNAEKKYRDPSTMTNMEDCQDCNGTGYKVDQRDKGAIVVPKCPNCRGTGHVPARDTRVPLVYFMHPMDGSKCYILTCGGQRNECCEWATAIKRHESIVKWVELARGQVISSEVGRGHVVQSIGGNKLRTITELSARELADIFDNEDTQRDIGAAYVSESHNNITLDGTWNVSDLLTALAAKLAEEG